MCNFCYAEENNISMISKGPTMDMCDKHYFEWVEEKVYNDLDRDEEYFHFV